MKSILPFDDTDSPPLSTTTSSSLSPSPLSSPLPLTSTCSSSSCLLCSFIASPFISTYISSLTIICNSNSTSSLRHLSCPSGFAGLESELGISSSHLIDSLISTLTAQDMIGVDGSALIVISSISCTLSLSDFKCSDLRFPLSLWSSGSQSPYSSSCCLSFLTSFFPIPFPFPLPTRSFLSLSLSLSLSFSLSCVCRTSSGWPSDVLQILLSFCRPGKIKEPDPFPAPTTSSSAS